VVALKEMVPPVPWLPPGLRYYLITGYSLQDLQRASRLEYSLDAQTSTFNSVTKEGRIQVVEQLNRFGACWEVLAEFQVEQHYPARGSASKCAVKIKSCKEPKSFQSAGKKEKYFYYYEQNLVRKAFKYCFMCPIYVGAQKF
jgi:hypothetical protein